ncbi:hypothetical protein [Halodesulfovibrio spirochaetisodalis]|uniref:Uncharacterized protein n=1 Tax=Halodesulfovibrio spirochaetisodalis TaxID=1560234 RepID=A0A1B7XC27_9BACT|nr:hypothetical protein [Halodesulfovibrio spirochaetisodalis]OBQ50273.1 hypothetical protein SP90_10180 [Halodesulfovibrio spirochaetisodalis]
MDLLVLGFCGLMFVCLVAGCNFFATAKLKEEIYSLKQSRRTLTEDMNELKAALISKREEKKLIMSKLRMAKHESNTQEKFSFDAGTDKSNVASDMFEQELLNQKVITPRELERVKKYRRSTSCPYDVAETVVMLGYATQSEVDRVKAKFA